MAVKHITQDQFDEVTNQQGKKVLVDFFATWCGPCKMLAPVMEDLAGKYEGKALVGKVNVDDEPDLAMRFGVMSIPTVVFLKNGKEVDRKVGVMPPESFIAAINANL